MKRREFLQFLTVAINGVIGLMVAIPAAFWLLPSRRFRKGRPRYKRIARFDSISSDAPSRVVVNANRWDKFTRYPPGPIGAVWLLRTDSPAEIVRAFQTVCPHLGCSIAFAADREVFSCPCHASEFDLSGVRNFGPSPRDMDELECRISDPDEAGERWVEVRYEEFETGSSNKQGTVSSL